jgi:Cys-rich repeat protein
VKGCWLAVLLVGCNARLDFPTEADAAITAETSPVDASHGDADAASRCTSGADCKLGMHCDTHSGACVQCLVDLDCAESDLKRCDTAIHRCVECGVASDCKGAEETCAPTRRCARGCKADANCTGSADICDTKLGICIECRVDGDCDSGDKHICDPVDGRCVSCASDAHCTEESPRCDPVTGKCVQCSHDEDCPAGEICDFVTGTCE